MSEHDSSWATGAPDGRATGQATDRADDPRPDSGPGEDIHGEDIHGEPEAHHDSGAPMAAATTGAVGGATPAAPGGDQAETTVPVPAAGTPHQSYPTAAFPTGPYQGGAPYQE